MLHDGTVDCPCAEAASDEENRLSLRVQSEALACLSCREWSREDVLADRIACQDNLPGREETVHAFVGYTDFLHTFRQQLVGDTGVGVLLLNQAGDSHLGTFIEGCTAGISAHTHSYLRFEVLDDFPCHAQALPELEQYFKVLQLVCAVKSLDRQSLYLVAGSRDALHLHSSFRTHEEDFRFRVLRLDGIGNRYSREDMSSRSAAADDDS